ncbi:MAG: hypothetical protein L3J97_00130 [Thermoplasmata archaeon]|nr:hypothetical protein [Thermoplasmata archaeon]
MGTPAYGSPYGGSPDISLTRQLLSVGRILALVLFIVGIIAIALTALQAAAFAATWGYYPTAYFGGFGYYAIMVVVNLIAYIQLGPMLAQFEQGQYAAIRERILIWAILTLIFGVLVGILLLIAYVKLEEIGRSAAPSMIPGKPGPMTAAPMYSAPAYSAAPATPPAAPSYPTSAPPPPPIAPSSAPSVPVCTRCGRPATWVPQYSRWYCYTDSVYL